MRDRWTGGQYSLLRFVLGVTIAAAVVADDRWSVLARVVGFVASIAVALGWLDRFAALLLAFEWLLLMDPVKGHELATTAVAGVLLLHAAQPRAPYGSVDGRGRTDPGGGWAHRRFLQAAAAALLLLILIGSALDRASPLSLGFALAALFTFDPAWIPRRSPGAVETLFYDGACGLCHRAVRFLLAEDPEGAAFRFAPLGSDTFLARVPEAERALLPDSLVLLTAQGRVLTRSAAVRHLMERLGGIWRALAAVLRIVPAAVQDGTYDTIARIRHRLFARPKEACPLLPPHLRARFLA